MHSPEACTKRNCKTSNMAPNSHMDSLMDKYHLDGVQNVTDFLLLRHNDPYVSNRFRTLLFCYLGPPPIWIRSIYYSRILNCPKCRMPISCNTWIWYMQARADIGFLLLSYRGDVIAAHPPMKNYWGSWPCDIAEAFRYSTSSDKLASIRVDQTENP